MAKRSPRRRKAPKQARRSIGPVWWAAGFLIAAFLVVDANRETISGYAPKLAALMGPAEERSTPASPDVRAPSEPRERAKSPPPGPARNAAEDAVRLPPAEIRTASASPDIAAVAPKRRPSARGSAPRESTVTGRPTPLRREPSAEAPVWLTLAAGRPLRVTQRQGDWRLVESGIFTGWISAEFVETRPEPPALPRVSASTASDDERPVPPGTIPSAVR